MSKVEKEVRFLKIYTAIITIIFLVFLLTAFTVNKSKKFDEIDVERINIVEKNGKLKMVISNKERQHPGTMDGKYYKEREGQRPAGMIFFSEKGDEIGGLIFDGNTGEGQGGSLTFDKFRGDQTIQITHQENKDGNYYAGLNINDENMALTDRIAKLKEIEKLPTKEEQKAAYQKMQDNGEFLVNRLFIGRGRDKASYIELNDAKGKTRISLSVEPNGNPKLNFLDENGKVIYSLPEDAKK
ncbi:MAG TPA: hypothetical protein PKY59_14975 [Pyrinomonadaceae bacterium]|nr:hypothetical protein [Pyrinomonadaceae bacterium]